MKIAKRFMDGIQFALLCAAMMTSATLAVEAASPGALDSSFGKGGKVITSSIPDVFNVADVVAQPDGKIVAVGSCAGAGVDVCLLRYDSNGSLDPTFGTNGKVLTDFSNGSDFALGAVVQPDGRIVVGGSTQSLAGTSVSIFARYLPDGSLDQSFGTNGKATFDVPGTQEIIFDIALQSDGKIVAVGVSGLDFLTMRINGNGFVDPTFGGSGFVTTNIGIADEAAAVAIQPDGKIVVAGRTDQDTVNFGLVRYNPDGTLDRTFTFDGISTVDFNGRNDLASSVALQADGKIVVAGRTAGQDGLNSAVARLNTDGTIDTTFAGDGKVITDTVPGSEQVQKVQIESGDRIVAVIQPGGDTAGLANFGVVRYSANGSLDTSFGNGGIVNTDISGGDFARASAIDGDKLVVAGQGLNVSGIRLARYNLLSAPSASSDFDGDGLGDATVFRPSQATWFTLNSGDGTVSINQFGVNGDLPVDGDFDGDGRADLAIFRPSDGGWFVQRSSNPTSFITVSFGRNGDRPVAGDYDKDGKTDIAVWRPSNGTYFILRSSDNQTSFFAFPFGQAGDIPLSGAAQ
jgi:uncharacterized delta-60 repeat protein